MLRRFFGNLIFTIIVRILCGNHVDIFLEFFLEGFSLTDPCCLEGLLAMPPVVLRRSQVCRDARFKYYSIASVTVVQTVHISVAKQLPCHVMSEGKNF